jgi:four helix bundle protein
MRIRFEDGRLGMERVGERDPAGREAPPLPRPARAVEQFEDLEVFKKARELTQRVYIATRQGDFSRDFGLRDQIRRAAVSVMANVAEGFERGGDREFRQFLAVAKGSAGEVRAHLYVALDAGYLTQEEHRVLQTAVREISRMIWGLMEYLREPEMRGSKYR